MQKTELTIDYNYETIPDEVLEKAFVALLSMWNYKHLNSIDKAREHTTGYIRKMKFER